MKRIVVFHPPDTYYNRSGRWCSDIGWNAECLELMKQAGSSSGAWVEWPCFVLPEQLDVARDTVQRLTAMGHPPKLYYLVEENPSWSKVHETPWYYVCVTDDSYGFDDRGVIADEWPCELPPVAWEEPFPGCSYRKKQVKKFKIITPNKIIKRDLFRPYTRFMSDFWQYNFVSRRMRDALLESGLNGFHFLPIAGPNATDEQLLVESGEQPTDSQDLFQWVIHGRTKPSPIDEYRSFKRVDGRSECKVCGQRVGAAIGSTIEPADMFDTGFDVQICDQFVLPNGDLIPPMMQTLYVNSKFVEICVKNKFKGVSRLKGRASQLQAVYLGPEL